MEEKTEDKPKIKRIIELLRNSRRAQRVNVEQLAEGVCTESMLQKVERGERTVNRNGLNRLLSRLGIDQKKYEKYLYYNEYDEWKLKNDIINAIEDNELDIAEKLLATYDIEYATIGNIELQFSVFMKAQVLQHKDSKYHAEAIYKLYREAMLLTVPNAYNKSTNTLMLSTDELNLILECRNREMITNDVDEIFDIYCGFINYIEMSKFDIGAKAKIYPKVVVYMYNHVKGYVLNKDERKRLKMYKQMLEYCKTAMDILQEDCKSYYMCELFEAYMAILVYLMEKCSDEEERNAYKEILKKLNRLNDTYIDVCKQYEISYLMLDCCYLYREEDVYCINDVIRKRRKMIGMTMTKLSEGICSERTIRRLERRECKALEGIVDELFCKLGMSSEYANMGIVTENRDDVELYEKCRRAVNDRKYTEAIGMLEQLEHTLIDNSINKQAILEMRSLAEWYEGQIDEEQHKKNLELAVSYTIDINEINNFNKDIFITYAEIIGLQMTCTALKRLNQLEESYEKMKILIKYFNLITSDKLDDVYVSVVEVVLSFYGSLIGSMHYFDKSNSVLNKLNKLLLKMRRTNIIHINMYNIIWNIVEEKKVEINYVNEIQKCVNLCQLTKNEFYERCYLDKLNS